MVSAEDDLIDVTADVTPEGNIAVTFIGFDPPTLECSPQRAWETVLTLRAQGCTRAAAHLERAVLKAHGAIGSA